MFQPMALSSLANRRNKALVCLHDPSARLGGCFDIVLSNLLQESPPRNKSFVQRGVEHLGELRHASVVISHHVQVEFDCWDEVPLHGEAPERRRLNKYAEHLLSRESQCPDALNLDHHCIRGINQQVRMPGRAEEDILLLVSQVKQEVYIPLDYGAAFLQETRIFGQDFEDGSIIFLLSGLQNFLQEGQSWCYFYIREQRKELRRLEEQL
mmetsp:Transcript_12921/g.32565  ORF Transcript_12921/g.32565 Transcript_12921/m.32565 type:complete len:210 (-) Transcript_12921:572-1201(-)